MPDLRAQAEEGARGAVVEGHAAVFGEPAEIYGMFKEVIVRGAFDRTDFRDVLFCVNHDWGRIPLARSRNNNANSTLQLSVDDTGLAIRALLDIENNADARALYSSIARGDIQGMSFAFEVREDRWEGLDTDMPTRYILDFARVFEVSAVSFPAYAGTDISARDQRALESAARALESARSRLESRNGEQREPNEIDLLRYRSQLLMKV